MPDKIATSFKPKRALGLFELTAYGVGIILGAGIYALIGKAAAIAGNSLWMAFLIGAAVASLTGLSYAELGAMYPKEAAEYVYTKKAFKSKRFSFMIGWLIVLIGLVTSSTVSLGFGGYLEAITGVPTVTGAIMLILALSLLNFWGIKESARANIAFTLVELAGLVLIVFLGLNFYGSVNYFEMPMGFAGVFGAAVLIFFAYIGFEDIVNMAEETRLPKRVIPKAILLSVAITTVLYILVSLSAISILPWETLGASSAPLADVAEAAVPGLSFLLSVIALFATANTVLIVLIVESRMIWGMARESSLPKLLGRLHQARRTPWIAIIITAMFVVAVTAVWDIRSIAELADIGAFVVFFSVNIAMIALRYAQPEAKRPFRVPLSIGKFPVLPAIGAAFCAFMFINSQMHIMAVFASVVVSGLIVYEVLKRARGHEKQNL